MRLILFLFILLQGTLVFGQTPTTTDETQVQQLIENMFNDLFSSYNADKIATYMSDDFILLEDGMIWDNQIIAGYLNGAKAKGNLPTRTNRFEFIQTKVFGDRAWVAYKNWATISINGNVIQEIHWIESANAVKTDSGWKLELMHSTPVKPDVQ